MIHSLYHMICCISDYERLNVPPVCFSTAEYCSAKCRVLYGHIHYLHFNIRYMCVAIEKCLMFLKLLL